MHLKRGKATYRLRNVGIMQCAFFYRARGEPHYSLQMIELPRLLELRHESRLRAGAVARPGAEITAPGIPTIPRYFAYCFERRTIELHPAPAYAGELEVRYYPPLEVA